MRNRYLVTVCTIAAMVVSVSTLATAQSSTPLRTAWGDPDLGGVWNNSTLTPFQRPERLGDQEFLTEEEAANVEQEAVDRNERLLNEEAQRTEVGGNIGAYNNFWMDRGTNTVDTRRTSLIIEPSNGRYPALTPAGQRRAAEGSARRGRADSFTDFSAGVRCILGFNAGPPFTPSAYNNNMQLFQTPDTVVIMTEMVNTSRVIPLDGRPHLDADVLQWSGDSRGRWEGDTLVVETRNFDPKRRWRNSSHQMRLVERFTRVDADTLEYEFTITDPDTWVSAWTASVPLRLNPDPVFEYACHEGNYSMPVMLGGARVEEREAAG